MSEVCRCWVCEPDNLRSRVRDLIAAIEAVQDWEDTRVGACIKTIREMSDDV